MRGFLARLSAVTLAALIIVTVWQSLPLLQGMILGRFAEPRPVTPRGDLMELEKTTIAIFEASRDSVVFITTAERVFDPWTRNAYDVPRGTGSGFVWDNLGHVVTNHHVIAGASRAVVRLADGRSFPARLVGSAPEHDLAVLQIGVGSDRPPPIPLGTSADLRVGQMVLAIGNPFGLDWTMTTGIVSALDRELAEGNGPVIRGLIQTDAAINPGNSGGPLLDSAGRLIGVNTAIYSPSGSSAGIGFAVPVETVNRVVPQLIATGRYAPPDIGARFDPRADALIARAGLHGAPVLGVRPGGPAERAGLRPARLSPDGRLILGDVIIALDGRPIADSAALRAELDGRSPGERVTLRVLRDGAEIEIPLTLAPPA
ncbi:MAG: PDZ domain-containing protein [Alphaproteobacteria bacterium]|nr:MAG: PDZ domain-containing protein [Alphaproteobacteria bacterium]